MFILLVSWKPTRDAQFDSLFAVPELECEGLLTFKPIGIPVGCELLFVRPVWEWGGLLYAVELTVFDSELTMD